MYLEKAVLVSLKKRPAFAPSAFLPNSGVITKFFFGRQEDCNMKHGQYLARFIF